MDLYTIGFTKKTARAFFEVLITHKIKRVIDIRLNNKSQLAGFAKGSDLEYFLKTIANIGYLYMPQFAPTKELLDSYRQKTISWEEYEREFSKIMTERQIEKFVTPDELDHACLLCSEPTAGNCHRRLVAEYIQLKWGDVTIHHL